jgi:hypothetical protein
MLGAAISGGGAGPLLPAAGLRLTDEIGWLDVLGDRRSGQ